MERAFVREFGRRHPRTNDGIRGVQCCTCRKGECLDRTYLWREERGTGHTCGGPGITSLAVCSSHIRGALLHCDPVSARSLPVRTSSNSYAASPSDKAGLGRSGNQLPPTRPPLERLLANQLARYRLTESDVFEYVQCAMGATAFVTSKEPASLCAIWRTLRTNQRQSVTVRHHLNYIWYMYKYIWMCLWRQSCLLWTVGDHKYSLCRIDTIYMKRLIPRYVFVTITWLFVVL